MRKHTIEISDSELSYLLLLLGRMQDFHDERGGSVDANDIIVSPTLTVPLLDRLWDVKQKQIAEKTVELTLDAIEADRA